MRMSDWGNISVYQSSGKFLISTSMTICMAQEAFYLKVKP